MSEKFWFLAQVYSIIHITITILFLAHILRVKKTPTSTLAWFFIVLIQPILGVFLYIVFGNRKIKSAREQVPLTFSHDDVLDPIQRFLISSGSLPPCRNTNLKILKDAVEAFHTLMELIEDADNCIFVETFIFSGDDVGITVLKKLTEKAKAGLDVRIMIDAFGTILSRHPSFTEFKKSGGRIAKFMPLIHKPFRGRANLRNHRKLILIDHTHAITGGMNIANEYMGPVHDFSRWLDMGLLAQGPLVTQMERIFWEDWCFATQDECPPATPYPKAVTSSEHVAQLVSSGPNNPFDPIYEWLLTALYQAKERIWITTPYFIPDESLAKALELASKRGVEVRLLLPARSNHLLADLGRTSYLEQVQDAGVKLYFHPQMIHAKLTLIDDKYGLISSANMDSRSLLINYELGVCMFSPDEIKQLKEWTELHFRQCRVGLTDSSLLGEWVGAFARLIGPLI